MVTHHVDEIPRGVTHVAMMRDGRITDAGALGDVLTSESLSDCFEMSLVLERRPDGRFAAWARDQPVT